MCRTAARIGNGGRKMHLNPCSEAAYRSYADLTFPIEREEAASAVAEKLIQIILTELKP